MVELGAREGFHRYCCFFALFRLPVAPFYYAIDGAVLFGPYTVICPGWSGTEQNAVRPKPYTEILQLRSGTEQPAVGQAQNDQRTQ